MREIEGYAAEAGWDQPARLFALVPTADLLTQRLQVHEKTALMLRSLLK